MPQPVGLSVNYGLNEGAVGSIACVLHFDAPAPNAERLVGAPLKVETV
jgi:hypothetical protein